MKICFLFPGQGTQKPGMMRGLENDMDKVQGIFEIASEVTHRDVRRLCMTASEEELRKTENTQIAVTAMNLAYDCLMRQEYLLPDLVAGHSLGQFSALNASGVFTLSQTFQIVQKRAQMMEKIQKTGILCTILGMTCEEVKKICKTVDPSGERVAVALHNTENQVVIGGEEKMVREAERKCMQEGAVRTAMVNVSNAFHTPLMREMEAAFFPLMDQILLQPPKCGVLLNCKGDYARDVEEIRQDIKEQCTHMVRWYDCMKKILLWENIIFVEVGVGKTLTGMIRSMRVKEKCYVVSDGKDLKKLRELCSR
ncbi:MAG: ACP S-malonyltransferase [Lachnospiraceae bacterium]|nr:ACP S-malonyltransferase [Robinsoniella sp.]MDY3767835.1 ACP S-malonyltransferase [Lachnospiraceae bacterium]